MLRPALGGLLTALVALALPGVLGTGYGWVQTSMGDGLLDLPLWVVLALPFAKILATSTSIGSGGSGGIFGPGMVIGGFTGAAIFRLLNGVAPTMPHTAAPFVVVGMIACFGAIAHAPLAVMLMVVEMTGSLYVFAPAMVAVGLATLIVGDKTIYRSQLRSRADSPAHRLRFGLPLLGATTAREAMAPPRLLLTGEITVADALAELADARVPGAPLVDAGRRLRGVVGRRELDGADPGDLAAEHAAAGTPIAARATLDTAAEALAGEGRSWIPVVEEGRVVGILGMSELIDAYRRALAGSLRRLAAAGRTVLVEERIGEPSRLAGATVAGAGWPRGTVVLSVQHGEQLEFADGSTRLQLGDLITALARPSSEEQVRALVRGGPPGDESGGEETSPPGPSLI